MANFPDSELLIVVLRFLRPIYQRNDGSAIGEHVGTYDNVHQEWT